MTAPDPYHVLRTQCPPPLPSSPECLHLCLCPSVPLAGSHPPLSLCLSLSLSLCLSLSLSLSTILIFTISFSCVDPQIAHGVEHIHASNCVHRDLKLENIMFAADNSLRIVDFGLSAEVRDANTRLDLTCGSLLYVR
jgi:serine/threonine protein kinase